MARKVSAATAETAPPQARLAAVIKSARDIMRKDAGLNGDTDRIPQVSWLLFLKCFDDLEKQREVTQKKYRPTIEAPYRWRDWAADPNTGATGPELLEFVNGKLLPYLRNLRGSDGHEQRDVLSAVFKETFNRMLSGYLVRDVVNLLNQFNFNSQDDIHVMARLYESMLREMRDSAGDSGEFYTPRPVIRFIVQQVDPRLGDRVLDPAAGTGGFLVETYEHIQPRVQNIQQRKKLNEETLHGIEKKPMPYLLGMMNLLLHGVERPNLLRDNALANPLTSITEKARFNVIVTNPPFGGEEERGIQENFPQATRASETALLFLQFIMKSLKAEGRCGMIVPNGTLFGDGVCALIKQQLLEEFDLHTIVRLPNGVFAPYTPIATNLLFFDRTGPTREIWFYEQPAPEGRKNYSKTQPLRFEEFTACQAWWGGHNRKDRAQTDQAWRVSVKDVMTRDSDGRLSINLDLKNPRQKADFAHLPPEQLMEDILSKEHQLLRLLEEVKRTVQEVHS
jgi:type I restriction enzyme M protein